MATKTMRLDVADDPVELAIRHALSRPPAAVGARLRLEQDLADTMKVSRNRVRVALASLNRSGVLLRRRGSGTYLRRMPAPLDDSRLTPEVMTSRLSAEDLLENAGAPVPGSPRPNPWDSKASRLTLSLWSNLDSAAPTARCILKGMTDRVEELGCRLNLRSINGRGNQMLPREVLAERLAHDDSDGHIVLDAWAEHFLAASPSGDRPIIFFDAGSVPIKRDSLVFLDTQGAMVHAMLAFKESGFKRIGVLAATDSNERESYLHHAYSYALRGLELEDDCFMCHRSVEIPRPGEVVPVIRRAFEAAIRPDSLYVADDLLLPQVLETLTQLGLTPGVDIGLITLHNRGLSLPPAPAGERWSAMEVDPEMFGHLIINKLMDKVQYGSQGADTVSVHYRWDAGTTHLCKPSR